MFTTQPAFELSIPALDIFDNATGVKNWRAFELALNDFWFVIEFLTEDSDGDQYWNTIMMSQLPDVLEFLSSESILEHRINMVIPAEYSDVQQLQMKVVVAIYSAEEDGQESMTIYVASDGTRYVDSLLGFNENQATNRTTLYLKKDINVKNITSFDE
jgi:hypothetical protein